MKFLLIRAHEFVRSLWFYGYAALRRNALRVFQGVHAPVQVEGVHPDYGERLRVLTKQYVIIDDNVTLVEDEQQSNRKLQLQLVRDTAGVVVVFEMHKSKEKIR